MSVVILPSSSAASDFAIGNSGRPDELPDNWSYVPLRSVCEKTSTWNPAHEQRDRFNYIDVSSVSNEQFWVTGTQEIAASNAPSRARKIVKAGDVIYATVRPSLKRVAWIEPHHDDQIASTAFCIVRADRKRAISKFLYYVLLSDDMNRKIIEHERGASYPAVTDKDVLNQFVPLPFLDEQEKIAAVLWKIQKAVEIEDAIVRNTRDLKKSLLRRLFTRGLRGEPLKETEIGPLPQSWIEKPLGELVEIEYGAQAAVASALSPSIGTPILTNINISNEGHLDFSTLRYYSVPPKKRDRLILRRGDVLFNWRSGSKNHIGKTALFSADGEYTYSSFILRFRTKGEITSDYLCHYFYFIKSEGFFTERGTVSSINNVYNASLAATIPVLYPSLGEQREIADILQTVDLKIDIHESKKRSLQELFKTMLHKLLTAQIRVNDLEINTSEVSQTSNPSKSEKGDD